MTTEPSQKLSLGTLKKLVSPALVGSVVLLSSLLPVSAKTARLVAGKEGPTMRGKTMQPPQKGAIRASNNKVIKVTLQVTDGEANEQKNKQKLTRIGLVMIGLSVLYGLMSSAKPSAPPADEDLEDLSLLAPKHISRGQRVEQESEDFVPVRAARSPAGTSQSGRNRAEIDRGDDLFADEVASSKPARTSPASARRTVEEFSSTDAEAHRLPPTGESDAASAAKRKDGDRNRRKAAKLVEDAPPLAAVIPSPADSQLGSPPLGEVEPEDEEDKPLVTASNSRGEESGSKSPMGFLSKFFQKPGGGRPAEIATALQPNHASADAALEERYRVLSAQLLLDSMPLGTFPDAIIDKVMHLLGNADLRGTGISAGGAGVATVPHLQEAMELAGLSLNQAAEAYADVANALLVSIVDSAVDAADRKDDAGALAALENAAKFIVESGRVYNAVTPGANIAPIQYNGRARGSKLEDLYYRYSKAGTDMGSLLSGFLGGPEGESAAATAETNAEERAEQLASLQFYFNIKEKRRSGIEQRIMRESMMDMTKSVGKLQSGEGGGEGMDSLAQLLDGMLGKGGDGAQMPRFPAPDMLQGLGAEAAGMGLPDFSKLSPEEAAALSKDALSAVSNPLISFSRR
jgi:hypothetical protein